MEYRIVKIIGRKNLTLERMNRMEKFWEEKKGTYAYACSKCNSVAEKMVFVQMKDTENLYTIPLCDNCFKIDDEFSVPEIDLVMVKK